MCGYDVCLTFLGEQMTPLSAWCLQPYRHTLTQWQCVWSLKTSPVKVPSLAPRTPTRRTPPSASSTPRRVTSGNCNTHTTSIKGTTSETSEAGWLCGSPPRVTDISHYCNAVLMCSIFPHSVLNSAVCVWQGSGASLMTCARIFTAVKLFCIIIWSPVSLLFWCSVPRYLHISMNLTHFCHGWDVTLCFCVCVTVVAGLSQWQARVLIWCRASPCRCWELDKQWVTSWIVSHFAQ